LFEKWITKGPILEDLSLETKLNSRQLLKYFHLFLKNTRSIKKVKDTDCLNLKVNAAQIYKGLVIIVFKHKDKIIYWKDFEKENYNNYLYCFYQIFTLGYTIKSVTSDKHKGLIKAVNKINEDFRIKGKRKEEIIKHRDSNTVSIYFYRVVFTQKIAEKVEA